MANLLENPGFEENGSGVPTRWNNFNSPSNVTRAVATDFVHSGSNSWKMATTDAATADGGLTQTEFTGRAAGKITVVPNTNYTISGWIKTALTDGQVHIHVKLFESGYSNESGYDTDELTGTNDWTLNTLNFTTGPADVISEVMLCFGAYGNPANGTAWFDDISLDVTSTPGGAEWPVLKPHGNFWGPSYS